MLNQGPGDNSLLELWSRYIQVRRENLRYLYQSRGQDYMFHSSSDQIGNTSDTEPSIPAIYPLHCHQNHNADIHGSKWIMSCYHRDKRRFVYMFYVFSLISLHHCDTNFGWNTSWRRGGVFTKLRSLPVGEMVESRKVLVRVLWIPFYIWHVSLKNECHF